MSSGSSSSDGDTRRVNAKVVNDQSKFMVPLALFRSFKRSDQMWVLAGLIFLVVLLNVVFAN